MRYVWDRYDDYFGPERLGLPARWVVGFVAEALRAWDVATAGRVHAYVANSDFVAARIRRHYGRDAEVIPPPVDTELFRPASSGHDGYYLFGGRLVEAYKRPSIAIEAFLDRHGTPDIDRFNLSDLCEYMPLPDFHRTLEAIVGCSRPGARRP